MGEKKNRWSRTLGLIHEVVPDAPFQPMNKLVQVSQTRGRLMNALWMYSIHPGDGDFLGNSLNGAKGDSSKGIDFSGTLGSHSFE